MRTSFIALMLAVTPAMAASQLPPSRPAPVPQRVVQRVDSATATLVLLPRLEAENARVIVMRRSKATPGNVLLVTSATTASDLTRAIAALIASRRRHGDVLDLDMRTVVAAVPDSTGSRSPDFARARRDLARLREAGALQVDGVGTYPALTVRLAPVRPLDARR